MSSLREVEHLQIPLPHILSATNNFDEKNLIGKGGFGKVYQGQSEQYGIIAVKQLDHSISGQGQHEFMMEIALLSAYKHKNLVSLVGFCDQGGEKILVYKHERNGSLDKLLQSKDLNWIQRLRICLGAAHGLKYLHHDVGPQHRVLHRDIKSSNILLDENWNAKISDFGLSKISPANVPFTFLISNACGTIGYLDPGYLTTGVLTQKSDVYSFGVVLFEILCGRLARVAEYQDERHLLFNLVKNHYKKGTLYEIIDSYLKEQMNSASLNTFLTIAYQCLKKHREDRPTMSQVVAELQNALDHQLVASYGSWHALNRGLCASNVDTRSRRYDDSMPKSIKDDRKVNKLLRRREDENYIEMLMEEDLNGVRWVDTEMINNLQEISIQLEMLIIPQLLSETIHELCSSVLERPIHGISFNSSKYRRYKDSMPKMIKDDRKSNKLLRIVGNKLNSMF